uniref:Uncharacterized protein n=1 Tax=Anopheles farauti TaxID=69004 RepID=A0A182QYQ5_9DIPT
MDVFNSGIWKERDVQVGKQRPTEKITLICQHEDSLSFSVDCMPTITITITITIIIIIIIIILMTMKRRIRKKAASVGRYTTMSYSPQRVKNRSTNPHYTFLC